MKRLSNTKLFLDGGNPKETAEATQLLQKAGFVGLDGQTTNPSLVAKNPDIAARVAGGEKLTQAELLEAYRHIIQQIEKDAAGDISIEVYSDKDTKAETMIAQAREFATWTSSAVIKLPTTLEGIKAAAVLKDQMRLNMTLCFSQQQAAAVYAATTGSKSPVFLSPFIGRLDDLGINGMDLIANILKMYGKDSHVHVLTASVRSVDHILGALKLGTQAITMPFDKAFKPWAEQGFLVPEEGYTYTFAGESIPYEELDLLTPWDSFDLHHQLTETGLQKFADDWNSLLKR